MHNKRYGLAALVGVAMLTGCSTMPPEDPNNLCTIFSERPDWHEAAQTTREKWGLPLHISMAIMHQESRFVHDAAPPMQYFLGFIPTGRASSAYGYAQAKTVTWDDYVKETGNSWSRRDNFDDAIDFIGWYGYKSSKINKVSRWDAKAQYLNYHEGWGGYRRGTYQQKSWLVNVANKVELRSKQYAKQYYSCKDELNRSWLGRLFS